MFGTPLSSEIKIQKTNRTEQFTDYDVESFHRFVAYLNARGAEAGASGDIGRVLLKLSFHRKPSLTDNFRTQKGIRVRHWTRYFDICRVCDVNWNFVGKVESIVEDAAYMLKEVNLSHVVEYPYYR